MHKERLKNLIKNKESFEFERIDNEHPEWDCYHKLITKKPFKLRWVEVNKAIIPIKDNDIGIQLIEPWVDFFGIIQIGINDIISLCIINQAIDEEGFPIEEKIIY